MATSNAGGSSRGRSPRRSIEWSWWRSRPAVAGGRRYSPCGASTTMAACDPCGSQRIIPAPWLRTTTRVQMFSKQILGELEESSVGSASGAHHREQWCIWSQPEQRGLADGRGSELKLFDRLRWDDVIVLAEQVVVGAPRAEARAVPETCRPAAERAPTREGFHQRVEYERGQLQARRARGRDGAW